MKAQQEACSVQCVFPGTHTLLSPQPSAGAGVCPIPLHTLGCVSRMVSDGGAGDRHSGTRSGVRLPTDCVCSGQVPGCTALGSRGPPAWERNVILQKATQIFN